MCGSVTTSDSQRFWKVVLLRTNRRTLLSVGKKNEESQNWKPKSSSLRCPQELLECQMTSGTGRMRVRLALRSHIVSLQNFPRHLCVLLLYVACLKLRQGCQTEFSWFVCKRSVCRICWLGATLFQITQWETNRHCSSNMRVNFIKFQLSCENFAIKPLFHERKKLTIL